MQRQPRHRTQLLLDQQQYQALDRLAKNKNRSLSSLVREFIDQGIEATEASRLHQVQALERLAVIRRSLQATNTATAIDLVTEGHREREQQLSAVILGETPE